MNSTQSLDPELKQLMVGVINKNGACKNGPKYCVRHRVEKNNMSSVCWKNSGAPLMFTDNNDEWTIYGVASGSGHDRPLCASDQPRYYTSVPKFLTWIKRKLANNRYSPKQPEATKFAHVKTTKKAHEKRSTTDRPVHHIHPIIDYKKKFLDDKN